ncbi:MAG: 16S rRNA (uracil(1498)-N(3))-methyltransferase [Leptolinea sp.]|nr:16S rRNA (uracil(1498)-N(3))-methyltransferase [Leptolinea sp.]
MSGNRFFLSPEVFDTAEIHFPPVISRQICSVLRLKAGEYVTVLDNRGHCREVELVNVDARATSGKACDIQTASGEPTVRLYLCLALTQREKFEWMLQKGTELGVFRFFPLVTSRTLVQDTRGHDDKLVRWSKIIREAAEQCGRSRIPEIDPPQKLTDFLKHFPDFRGYILYEKEQTVSLAGAYSRQLSNGKPDAALLIGPEGGFSPDEVEMAVKTGFHSTSLGKRILRMETAALAACTICMSLAGEMGAENGLSGELNLSGRDK